MSLRCNGRHSWTRSIILLIVVVAIMENMILLLRIEKERYVQYSLVEKSQWITNDSVKAVLPAPQETSVDRGAISRTTIRQVTKAKKPSHWELAKLVNHQKRNNRLKAPIPPKTKEISEAEYYKRKPTKVNPFRTNFLIENGDICNQNTEMVIIVHSFHEFKDRRDAIRQTWGSIARTSYNQNGYENISLAFTFGVHKDRKWNEKLRNENAKFGDIIQGDFGEAYNNMTYKSLLEIKWMLNNCPKAKYLLKSDDDMLINMPHLINILATHNMTRSIMGPYNLGSRVYRAGKWAISPEVYPFKTWPEYESGSAYIISVDLLKDMFETAEYVPAFHIDDAYITGIVGKIIGAKHVKVAGFAFWNSRRPVPCDFIENKLVTGTKMTPSILLAVWKQIKQMSRAQCKAAPVPQPKPLVVPKKQP